MVEETTQTQVPKWLKSLGYVAFVILVIISGYLTLRAEFPHIESYFNPFYVRGDVGSASSAATPSSSRPNIESLLSAINNERAKVGVAPLTLDQRLNQSAQVKADDLLVRNYFDHTDPDGKHGYEIASEHAPECTLLGENLLQFTSDKNNTTEVAVRDWVNSPEHYKLIVTRDFKTTGFGISGPNVVQHFCQL